MKFQLAVNLERMDASQDMQDVARHNLEMVQMADQGGFSVVWAAEHHALEMTIAPNPFQILTWWANHTDRIRLGTAVAVAAYWHPINLAGEAAFTDLISGGRLEFGIGSGAYQREFDRMQPGLKQSDAWRHMQEMIPVLEKLWAGDYAHDGEFWSFPTATSVPKPLQQPGPPIWVAARAPITFDYAVKNGYNIMSWPLTRPFAEAELYKQRFDESLAANPGVTAPTFALMRHVGLIVVVDAAPRGIGIHSLKGCHRRPHLGDHRVLGGIVIEVKPNAAGIIPVIVKYSIPLRIGGRLKIDLGGDRRSNKEYKEKSKQPKRSGLEHKR